MMYGYIRVSTDKQTVENQRFEILQFCRNQGFVVEKWIEETISGTTTPEKRRLGALLNDIGPGDLIICSELSRLGRSLFMIMSILSRCMSMGAHIWTIKDGYRLGDDIQSKVLAFAFGLSAEIERNLISQRTKEALARCKAEGRKLGRPCGKAVRLKLSGREEDIRRWLAQGLSKAEIGRRLGSNRNTVRIFINTTGLAASPGGLAASSGGLAASPGGAGASPVSLAASPVGLAASPVGLAASPGGAGASPVSLAASPGGAGA